MLQDVVIDLIFTFRLIHRHGMFALDRPDDFDHPRTLIQQRKHLYVDPVNVSPAFGQLFMCGFQRHDGLRTNPSARLRGNASSAASRPGPAHFSMVRTIALPTTTPSAISPTCRTCSGV